MSTEAKGTSSLRDSGERSSPAGALLACRRTVGLAYVLAAPLSRPDAASLC